MKKLTYWWLVHALHWAVLYGSFVSKTEGAMYVLKFWVWVMAPLSLFLLTEKAASAVAKLPSAPVRNWLSMFQAWVTLGLLVWFGHIASAVAWGVVMVVVSVSKGAASKARKAASAGTT